MINTTGTYRYRIQIFSDMLNTKIYSLFDYNFGIFILILSFFINKKSKQIIIFFYKHNLVILLKISSLIKKKSYYLKFLFFIQSNPIQYYSRYQHL